MDDKTWDRYLGELDQVLILMSQYFSGRFKEKFTSGLSFTHLFIMRKIAQNPGITASNLAEQLSISPAAISKLVDQLVEGGFLERERSAKDRRVIILKLTSEGEHLRKENNLLRRNSIKEVLSDLPESDLKTLFDILHKIHRRVQEVQSLS